MVGLFNTILYQPIFNLLIGIYNLLPNHDIGLAIIILTVLIKLILWPLQSTALKSQKALQDLQPKLQSLKQKYPDKKDKDKMAKEMMEMYSTEKVNPLSSCLPLLIQIPVFIALYSSLAQGLQSTGFESLYSFVSKPDTIQPTLFGVIDLSHRNIALAVVAAAAQYFQAKMMMVHQPPQKVSGSGDEAALATMNKTMLYMMPLLTLFIGIKLPGGLALYWLVMTALMILQQYLFFRKKSEAVVVVAQPTSKE